MANALSEIDIMTDVEDFINSTTSDFKFIGVPFIAQVTRRNADGSKVNCPACNKGLNGRIEGQPDCPYCRGFGWLFDQKIEKGFFYRSRYLALSDNLNNYKPAGKSDTVSMSLITPGDVWFSREDKLFAIELLSDGKISIPMKIIENYTVYYSRQMSSGVTGANYNIYSLGS